MKGYRVYSVIQQLKERGFKKASVAKQLNINRRTVNRYWNMTIDEYEASLSAVSRSSQMDEYRDTIVGWLRSYPTTSASQVCNWLKEQRKHSLSFREKSAGRIRSAESAESTGL